MYYPYFRGKQYDLITIRDCADLMARKGFVPIIEPVKESINALTRTLQTLDEKECKAILIVNPKNGDHSIDSSLISDLFSNTLANHSKISAGIILNNNITAPDAFKISKKYNEKTITFIHAGFNEPATLARLIKDENSSYEHIFLEDYCGKLYRRHFKSPNRVLIRDSFKKRANKEHPVIEFFSDLHATFEEEGMNGFGDFLIVGDNYSESGGPAYAVAIHITYIDPERDDGMYVHHFKSDRNDTPTDPGGKFAEALRKLIKEIEKPDTQIIKTEAIKEFQALYNNGHFPGLGSVKKLSMKHHIETIANYFP